MTTIDLEQKKTCMGGSDIAAALGLSKFANATPLRTYLVKTGQAEPLEETEQMWFGTHMEPIVAMRYELVTGNKVIVPDEMLRHPDEPWAGANLDGRIDSERILEIKTAGRWANLDEWGEAGTDMIPFEYLCQTLWYLYVTGAEVCDVAALLGGNEMRVYHINRGDNEDNIAQIVERCRAFWFDHVQAGVPPDPSTNAEAVVRWPSSEGTMKMATMEDLTNIEALDAVKARQATDKKFRERVELAIKKSIGSHDGLADEAGTRVDWKSQFAKRFDQTRFKAERPDTYAEFIKVSETRVLRPKKRK